jgi:superfamily II DNA or RNA helicase
MVYPPFENAVSVDGFVRVEKTGKESLYKYQLPEASSSSEDDTKKIAIVIGKHKYYSLFSVQLIAYPQHENGTIKGSIKFVNPIHYVWNNNYPDDLKFYLAVIKFQTLYEKSPQDIESLKALVRNPLRYDFYLHDHAVSEKVTPRSITPVTISTEAIKVNVIVDRTETFYTIKCELVIGKTVYSFERCTLRFDYFIVCENQWFLCENIDTLHVIAYFKECDGSLTLSYDTFPNFQHDVLSKIEMHTSVEYLYHKKATASQIKKSGIGQSTERIIYLSDLDNFVTINPVIRYGNTEVPVLTKKQIYIHDTDGNQISVSRNAAMEDDFIALLIRQSPDFAEQLTNPLLYFYVHKKKFIKEDWFLPVFEDWRKHNITILGFNQLQGNKLNPHKAKITVLVSSGINWFNADVKVDFGKERASLKELYKSAKNKSKYIQLDDGTLGIIPEEWLRKFAAYFQAGAVSEENTIHIHKGNYAILSSLYDEHELQGDVKEEIKYFKSQLEKRADIKPVAIPKKLAAQLRPYQHEGLSWLNFLDDYALGGCLADDMGLGKSIQIIAFILLLKEKQKMHCHLLVVPTTLLYTWLEEFRKFAPDLSILVHHGNNRARHTSRFHQHDVVITSYGTLVTDVTFLREYFFDYIFLDESQNIKNPSSQRYKAARLLKSRNKIIISGTPFENNAFDLYAQFSFACPGLLGTKQHFRDQYAIPIGKFKSKRNSLALQAKIKPFILRRTKQEVAKDLPEKTEMVLYCEMALAQRMVYEAHEKEFRDFIAASQDDELAKKGIHILKWLTKLRQICNSPVLVDESTSPEGSSTKIEILMERIINLSGQHKILVFSQFVSMLDLIKERLSNENIGYTYLTGSTQKRERVVDQFQNDPDARVFLISLKAGGTGLNLTAAEYVFLVDPWWNPAIENQAIDRIYRIGQQKNVVAVRLICKDTIEEKIMILQETKTKLASDLLNTGVSPFRSFSKNDFLALANSSTREMAD